MDRRSLTFGPDSTSTASRSRSNWAAYAVTIVGLGVSACGDGRFGDAGTTGVGSAPHDPSAGPVEVAAHRPEFGRVSSTPSAVSPPPLDKFGVLEVYPTAPQGREWFIDMNDPASDPALVVSSATGTPLTKNADGSWRSHERTYSMSEGVRMEVTTPTGQAKWKNVEITGYVRLEQGPGIERFSWYGRSGVHTDTDPCDGTAYHMQLGYDGSVWYQKEIWHTGGYTPSRRGELSSVTSSIYKRWVGFKAMIYNVDGDTHVKNEIWLDANADGNWTQVNTIVDSGGWDGSETGCKRPIDDVMTGARPIVTFRADDAVFDFKSFSVREIQAP